MKLSLCVSAPALCVVATALSLASTACSSSSDTSGPADASPADATSVATDASPATEAAVDAAAPNVDASTACSPAHETTLWTSMDHAPITPPNRAALLDLNASDAGLTLGAATDILCPARLVPNQFGDDAGVAEWGSAQQVWLHYDSTTDIADLLVLWDGYDGTLTFKSADAQFTYVVALDEQITKNGQPFAVTVTGADAGADAYADAGGDGGATIGTAEADELYRGLVSTFAPTVALDPAGTSCVSTRKCLVGGGDGTTTIGYVYVPVLGLAIWFDLPPNPTVGRIDLNRVP
jgi:hypothetical protein